LWPRSLTSPLTKSVWPDSVGPGRERQVFRMLLVGYFEGIDSERGISAQVTSNSACRSPCRPSAMPHLPLASRTDGIRPDRFRQQAASAAVSDLRKSLKYQWLSLHMPNLYNALNLKAFSAESDTAVLLSCDD
ncbi:MAG: hypothetical protein ACJ8H8_30595, partial [Geminicoccaceae bacterium]